jgi:hypothetical protein
MNKLWFICTKRHLFIIIIIIIIIIFIIIIIVIIIRGDIGRGLT